MADAATTTPTAPTTPSASAGQPPAPPSAPAPSPAPELPPAPPAAKAALRPQSPKAPAEPDAHAGAPSERRDAEPVPKKRRLLEASEAADAQEPPAPARPLSDPQDILAKACFAVGIDSDLAESVVEEPLPPPQGSHLPPQPHAEAVHYVQGCGRRRCASTPPCRTRPPPTEPSRSPTPACSTTRSRRASPSRPSPSRAACPPTPTRATATRARSPGTSTWRTRGACRRPGPSWCRSAPLRRTTRPCTTTRAAPPPAHAARPPGAAAAHAPRPAPPVAARAAARPQAPSAGVPPRAAGGPRGEAPGARAAGGALQSAHQPPRGGHGGAGGPRPLRARRRQPPWASATQTRPAASRRAPPAPLRDVHASPRVSALPEGSLRPRQPPRPSGEPPLRAPARGGQIQQAPLRPRRAGPRVRAVARAGDPAPERPHAASPEARPRPPEPVRSPYASPQEGAWAAKRYPDAQDKAGEFIPPQRLREPKPCVELIPLRLPPSQEKEKRPGGEGHPVPSSPGPPQKTQVTAPISPATVTPVNRKASEKGAPAEKYARINTPDDGEIQEVSQGNGRLQLPSGLTVTETAASPPVRHNAAAKRENRDAFAHPEKSDESAKRSHSGSDSAGVPQAHADLRKKSEASTEGNSRPPEPQENCRENTPNSAGALELTASHHEPLELKHDRVSASKRQAENGDPHPATEEGHHRGLPSALEQYYSLHSSYYVSQGRSASEPPPGAAGPSANLLPGMRPASLPAATQISVSSAPPARDAAPPAGPKMNGRAKGAPEGNHDDDEAFVERLRFVLDDLVSVPEATLPKASRSPQQVLAYLVRQGGAKPSEHPCLRERLREDFVTMVKRYMPGSTIADWGWDACTPEQILDQLIKVSTGGDDGLNGGERSARTASAAQDDPLEDDVFTSSSDGPQGPRTAPVSHAHPRPSLPTPPAHRASPPGTSSSQPSAPPSTSSSHTRRPQL
nr:nascent polypeptide-associated complex subunit alpha, muscle-specific form-like [Penaeus vannamei]